MFCNRWNRYDEGRAMRYFFLLMLCFSVSLSFAQENPTPPQFVPQVVEVSATDGLVLRGDFYLQDATRPTVLLLHQLYSNRTGWNGLDTTLLSNGFNVLAVDLRGYGETGGRINWSQAVTDVQTWFDWLRAQGLDGNKIIPLGSSMGSVLAIAGCGNDSACPTAIAVSPGWEYYRIGVRTALTEQLTGKQVLVIYAERDRYPRLGIPKMLEVAPDVVVTQAYAGNAHGLDLLANEADTVLPLIVSWIANY
jgi:pimeloyl-ACP methyl ester carboxylesterase